MPSKIIIVHHDVLQVAAETSSVRSQYGTDHTLLLKINAADNERSEKSRDEN